VWISRDTGNVDEVVENNAVPPVRAWRRMARSGTVYQWQVTVTPGPPLSLWDDVLLTCLDENGAPVVGAVAEVWLNLGTGVITVTPSIPPVGTPLEIGAVGVDTYWAGRTDAAGQVSFLATMAVAGTSDVTILAQNGQGNILLVVTFA
jgi:hypothetical protein